MPYGVIALEDQVAYSGFEAAPKRSVRGQNERLCFPRSR
jgi:hypothetical protein